MSSDAKKKFDLHSQQGVADLLRQVRISALPASTKTSIREMVLRYAQRGGDVGVREELEAVLATISLTPATILPEASEATPTPAEAVAATPKPSRAMGTRPVPTFGVSKKVVVNEANAAEPSLVVSEAVIPPTPPVAAPAAAPVVAEVSAPPPSQPPAPITPPEATLATPVGIVLATSDYAARIQEIKREVIAMIGNPVNLIDIDNTVGKQYMTALVEAMKKVNGGTKIEAATAMASLETAYAAVKALIEARVTAAVSAAAASPAATPTDNFSAPSITATVPPIPPPPPAFTPRTVPTEAELKPVSKAAETTAVGVHENLVAEASVDWQGEALHNIDTVTTEGTPVKTAIPLQDIPNYGYAESPKTETPKESIATPTVAATPGEYETALMTPAITAGLAQLLSEWKIFKSSGLFGMGPSGIEHPLYQRIKLSTMLTISNGTFEGADTEVLQSINDYINGWRYERSIIPQHTETFEHFLRRVVKKILDGTSGEHIV